MLRVFKWAWALSPAGWVFGFGALLFFAANVVLAAVILVQWAICSLVKIDVNRSAWSSVLATMAVGVLWHILLFVVIFFIITIGR